MPIYEFECLHCGNTYEALILNVKDILKRCPNCGRWSKRKLMSAPAIAKLAA